MSNINLQIGGRTYAVACAPGEEAHVTDLGRLIDSKLATMAGATGQPEARALLYAALLLADELHELKAAPAPVAEPAAPPPSSTADAEKLEQMADRLEMLASRLESAA